MSDLPGALQQHTGKGIAFVILGMFCISINDMLIKQLSGNYPLHQMIFVRSSIGILFSIVMVQFEGGWQILRTRRIGLHLLRGVMVVIANLTFFAALAVMPLADATAMFFVAPLFITLLSIPFLGEKVGGRRLGAVLVGFIGVIVMLRPGGGLQDSPHILIMLLPVLAAFGYACLQILTRKLGTSSKASALALYIQAMFIVVSLGFWLLAGDGRYALGVENPVLIFLLRAWTWPQPGDLPLFFLLGLMSAIVGYSLAAAYRSANASAIAPFEYVAMPLSIFWGWTVFGTLPDLWVWVGVVLIAGSGLYVFLRERAISRALVTGRPLRRW